MSGPADILVVMNAPKGGEALVKVELNAKEIAKATEVVRSGGQAIDSLLPPLRSADLLPAAKCDFANLGSRLVHAT